MKRIVRKVCLVGPECVGKTSLIRRFVDNSFEESYKSTIGVSISKKTMVKPGAEIALMIWDLEGDRSPETLPRDYIYGGSVGIIVVDLSTANSWSTSVAYGEQFLKINPSGKCLLVGNKKDLVEDTVDWNTFCAEGLQGTSIFSGVYTTSAKNDINIDAVFDQAAEVKNGY